MFHALIAVIVAEARLHMEEGDCPTQRSYNIEMLEDALVSLAAKPLNAGEEIIEAILSEAEVEWSYHEDSHRYPRDFWHVRMDSCWMSTGWMQIGEQEQSSLSEKDKEEGARQAKESLRCMLRAAQSALASPTPAIDPVTVQAEAFERAAAICDRNKDERIAMKEHARSVGQRKEGRDYETMAMQASMDAADIRGLM